MASSLRITRGVSSALIGSRRRFPFVGAFCVLSTLSISSLSSSSFRSGCAQSFSVVPLFRSSSKASSLSIKMEESSKNVPSIVVYVTVPNREAGKKLANSIVQEKLAACVNIVPGIESVYEWEGKVRSDSEELLIIKTRQSLLESLTEHVNANHEYDVPEVIALPITGGSDKYLEWLKNSTRN
ncbi:PREDICTED: protein CutA, chloroplastic-like [Camelina sativa]|uniref:Protein CutA, chloroplastic-like n=1 Tax=Camelina sativa TaxID=90675 RepID=A0ABM0SNH5_CAMSA|nr:PREDICTED: protein CutA, chloroplastic-like [Camelina sativa]